MPFSYYEREAIRERAGYASELSGRNDMPCEVSHRIHGVDEIDKALNVLCSEHYAYHAMAQGRAHTIGLTEFQNNWAMDQILQRLNDWCYANNVDIDLEIGRAFSAWTGNF